MPQTLIHTTPPPSSQAAAYEYKACSSLKLGYAYFGARYYDAGLSVWLSVDPLASSFPGLSSYTYCFNNPVVLVDLDGFIPIHYKVLMDDGTEIKVTIFTGDGQSFRFKKKGEKRKKFNYRSTYNGRKSLALLRKQRSQELNTEERFSGDIAKMNETYCGYKITDILVKLAEQNESIDLLIIGNHQVGHLNYSALSLRIRRAIQDDVSYNALYTTGDELFKYNGLFAIDKNRTYEMDSKWSAQRAQFIGDLFFNGKAKTYSRFNVSPNAISGLKLSDFGFDGLGITIGVKHKSSKNKKSEGHATVRFL